jgi:hypothetical protein
MKLPGRDRAFIPERKLTAYLLSLSHPVGRAKARFFRRFGFDASNTDLLRDELLALARQADVVRTEHTAYGTKTWSTVRSLRPAETKWSSERCG